MALPPILSQVMAQAGKVYSECMAQRHPANEDGLLYLMSSSFTEFANQLDELYTDLETSLDYFEDQVVSLFDANINPMYLHLHAAVPATGTGNWVQAIPNQNNSLGYQGYITGKGRFHCIGLTGSYASTTNKMRVAQCNGDKIPTNEEELYIFPLSQSGTPPISGGLPENYWNAYAWIAFMSPYPPSHLSGRFYLFENFGFLDGTTFTKFEVKVDPPGVYWSAALAWESNIDHDDIDWGI